MYGEELAELAELAAASAESITDVRNVEFLTDIRRLVWTETPASHPRGAGGKDAGAPGPLQTSAITRL